MLVTGSSPKPTTWRPTIPSTQAPGDGWGEILTCVATDVQHFPLLVHCASGKDRTGVVVATLLTILGIERDLVIREYLWSDGDIKRAWIEQALDGIGDPRLSFCRVDLTAIRAKVLGR